MFLERVGDTNSANSALSGYGSRFFATSAVQSEKMVTLQLPDDS
jgi:hypothetical protein